MSPPPPLRAAGLLIASGFVLALAVLAGSVAVGADAKSGGGGRTPPGAARQVRAGADYPPVASVTREEFEPTTPLPPPAALRTAPGGWGPPARQAPPPQFVDACVTAPASAGHAAGCSGPGPTPAAGASARLHVLLCVWLN